MSKIPFLKYFSPRSSRIARFNSKLLRLKILLPSWKLFLSAEICLVPGLRLPSQLINCRLSTIKSRLIAFKSLLSAEKSRLIAFKCALIAFKNALIAFKSRLSAFKSRLFASKSALIDFKNGLSAIKFALSGDKSVMLASQTRLFSPHFVYSFVKSLLLALKYSIVRSKILMFAALIRISRSKRLIWNLIFQNCKQINFALHKNKSFFRDIFQKSEFFYFRRCILCTKADFRWSFRRYSSEKTR